MILIIVSALLSFKSYSIFVSGKRMLYRDAHMTGWAYKDITQDDLRFPLVYGEGKRSRLLATIGVTRGFGDHDLKAQSNGPNPVYIKPFLTPQPEVRVLDIENETVTENDVLIMATDGLWDVVSNERVASIVDKGLKMSQKSGNASTSSSSNFLANDDSDTNSVRQKYKYISVAQELVMAARGKLDERNWKTSENGQDLSPATIDDISVFCIPILPFKIEYSQWKSHAKPSQSHATNAAILNGKTDHDLELEETGKTVAEADLDDPDDDMNVDPAEEVTVSDVSLTIKDEDDDDDDDDDEGQK